MSEKYDIGLVSQDTKFVDRCIKIATLFKYSLKYFDKVEEFSTDQVYYRLFIIAGVQFENAGEFSSFITTIKKFLPDTFLIYIEDSKSVDNALKIAKSFGINLTLTEADFSQTSKPEFICSQIIRATYLPIKSSDIATGVPITFDMYHLMPQREKFLKFCFEGDEIDAKKLEKIKSVNEVYIHRNHSEQFAQYIKALSSGSSEEGLSRRCRAQFLALYANYSNLVLELTEPGEKTSFDAGQETLKKCRNLASELLNTLAAHPNPWNIINSATIGDFGSIERAPAVAAYAGIIGTALNLEKIEDLMLAALLSELGILLLSPEIHDFIRKDSTDQLSPEQRKVYENYPLKSLSILLDRRMQLDEKLRTIIGSVHERSDKKGIPGKKFGSHIPPESFAVHFAYELDLRSKAKMGQPRVELGVALNQLIREESKSPAHFTLEFALRLRAAFPVKSS